MLDITYLSHSSFHPSHNEGVTGHEEEHPDEEREHSYHSFFHTSVPTHYYGQSYPSGEDDYSGMGNIIVTIIVVIIFLFHWFRNRKKK